MSLQIVLDQTVKARVSLGCCNLFTTLSTVFLFGLYETSEAACTEAVIAWVDCYRHMHEFEANAAGYLLFQCFH